MEIRNQKSPCLTQDSKKDSFIENRVADEALQRIAAAAARYIELTPLPGGQKGEEATEDKQEESQASAVWSNWRHNKKESFSRCNTESEISRSLFSREVQSH